MKKWSEEKEALFAFDSNTCVRAGAGSGKTTALVELNSRLLNEKTTVGKVELKEILAITFTEKAAGEIKERIKSMIDEQISSSTPEEELRWRNNRRDLFRASINTFHSFCMRVLRENPIEATTGFNFDILSGIDDEILKNEAVEQIIFSEYSKNRDNISDLVESIGFNNLKESIISTLSSVRAAGNDAASIYKMLLEQLQNCDHEFQESKKQLMALFCELRSVLDETKSSSKYMQNYLMQREIFEQKYIFGASNLSVSDESLNFLSSYDSFMSRPLKSVKEIASELKEVTETLKLQLRFLLTSDRQKYLIRLIEKYDSLCELKKREKNALDFEDLLLKTRDLLRDKKEIRKKYKDRFKIILADEFQDTNELQREIIYLIAEKNGAERDYNSCEEIQLEEKKLFIVGDAKQSIYRFRGADVTVFSKVIADVRKKGGRELVFKENFRTVKPVLQFLNPLFESVMKGGRDFAIKFNPEDRLTPFRESEAPAVELLLTKKSNLQQQRLEEAKNISTRILELVDNLELQGKEGGRKAQFRDFALLFKVSSAENIYIEALREANIPFTLHGGRGFYDAREIRDMVALLSYISDIEPEFSLLTLLRSPMVLLQDDTIAKIVAASGGGISLFLSSVENYPYGISGEELEYLSIFLNKLSILKKYARIFPVTYVMKKIYVIFQPEVTYGNLFQGAQKVANLRKLLTVAQDCGMNIVDFVHFLNQRGEEAEAELVSEGENAVTIMTVHKSKGLEFPIVILPDLDRPVRIVPDSNIYSSTELGVALRYKNSSGIGADTWFSDLLKRDNLERDEAESERVFYVALTRARDYLILNLVLKEEYNKSSWNDQILNFINSSELTTFYNSDLKEQLLEYPDSKIKLKVVKPSLSDRVPEQKEEYISSITPDQIDCILKKSLGAPIIPELTPTSIMTYDICQRKYLLDSFRPAKELFYRTTKTVPTKRPTAEMGWCAHYILERYDFEDRANPSSQIAKIAAYIKKEFPQLRASTIRWAEEAVLSFFKRIPSELKKIISSKSKYHKELELYFNLGELYISGILDLLVEYGDRVAILDYKFGTPSREKRFKYEKQLLTYAISISSYYPAEKLSAYIVFIDRARVHTIQVPISDEILEKFKIELMATGRDIADKLLANSEEDWTKCEDRSICTAMECRYIKRCWE